MAASNDAPTSDWDNSVIGTSTPSANSMPENRRCSQDLGGAVAEVEHPAPHDVEEAAREVPVEVLSRDADAVVGDGQRASSPRGAGRAAAANSGLPEVSWCRCASTSGAGSIPDPVTDCTRRPIVLPVNAYLLMAEEPVLIDTGVGLDGEDFIAAVSLRQTPRSLKWVWLMHDDADHTGSIQRIMEPRAQRHARDARLQRAQDGHVVASPHGAVHAIRVGDQIHVGDRTLTAVAPPLYDSPLHRGPRHADGCALQRRRLRGDSSGV